MSNKQLKMRHGVLNVISASSSSPEKKLFDVIMYVLLPGCYLFIYLKLCSLCLCLQTRKLVVNTEAKSVFLSLVFVYGRRL